LGSRSIAVVAVFAGLGLLFGWWAGRTGSILGVAVAHGLVAAGLVVVWPLVFS
jgi:membrane protease YdiL (CAAX protease family)